MNTAAAVAERSSLACLLEPKSVAVIGASRTAASLGRRVFDALVGGAFRGPVYPVNAQAHEIGGRACFPSARALPPGVDLAVVAVPRDAVMAAVDDCIAAGVRSLVVISAGFAETGPEGRALQAALVEKVRGAGVRMIGPNCLGLINTKVGLNASFSPVFPPRGHIALSSQSGALGLTILELARDRNIGLSTFASVGNKADISSNDLLEYWETDPETAVITLYLESFGNPRRFAELARRIGLRKPIIAVKSGRTRAGGRAASSHTAALAASDDVVDALFEAAGVIRADTIDEMFDVASFLASQPVPEGNRIAIVTNAGGPGILAVDACERSGLTVVEFSRPTCARLAGFLPPAASLGNPVDMVASASGGNYRQAIETVLAAPEVDALVVMCTPVDPAQTSTILDGVRAGIAGARAEGNRKPVVACLMSDVAQSAPLTVGTERIPVYAFPENAVRALAHAERYAQWRATAFSDVPRFDDTLPRKARRLCDAIVAARGEDWLGPEELNQLLGAYGIRATGGVVAATADRAIEIARELGYPAVAKLAARGLVHKSDVGGVRTNLRDDHDVRAAVDELMAAGRARGLDVEGVLIQPMVPAGIEMMIGVASDRLFGPVVGFGLGGTDVEIERDMHFRLAPLTTHDADALLHSTRALPRLMGNRGKPPADVPALADLLLRVSQLATDVPHLREMDLNPVIALPHGLGYAVVDARVKIGPAGRPPEEPRS